MDKKKTDTQNKPANNTDVKVNNHFSLSINFGDSVNFLALIAGFIVIRRISKKYKLKKKLLKKNKDEETLLEENK